MDNYLNFNFTGDSNNNILVAKGGYISPKTLLITSTSSTTSINVSVFIRNGAELYYIAKDLELPAKSIVLLQEEELRYDALNFDLLFSQSGSSALRGADISISY